MEDYVIVDSVLQAIHMSKFRKRPKHVKKYELNSSRTCRPRDNCTVSYDSPPSHHACTRHTMRPLLNTRADFFISSIPEANERNKFKTKCILEPTEKISDARAGKDKENHPQFFVKRLIEPKLSRQHTSRTLTLIKTPESTGAYFYDPNMEVVRKKSRKCIIFPEKKSRQEGRLRKSSDNQKVDIRKLVRQEWEQQRQQRKAQSKTSCMGHRTRGQTRRLEEEVRIRENEERQLKTSISERAGVGRGILCDHYNEKVLPLSKDEIKSKTYFIMHKYGVDSSRCYIKLG